MNHPLRLAIVRQKYRPDGGAERFIARALDALSNNDLELNVITENGKVIPIQIGIFTYVTLEN